MRVKLCGMRSERDVEYAVQSGADALGFLVGLTHFSEDKLDVDAARVLLRKVPPFISTVLVTHLIDSHAVVNLATALGVSHIQIHGPMRVEDVIRLREELPLLTLIKAIHVTSNDTFDTETEAIHSYEAYVDALLLDSRTVDRLGGTGQTHNWNVSRQLVQAAHKPVILAGGLNPENVRDAIERVRPYAVDVNSGVDDTHGDKDKKKCVDFVKRAKMSRLSRWPSGH